MLKKNLIDRQKLEETKTNSIAVLLVLECGKIRIVHRMKKIQSERCKGNMYAKKGNFTTYLNKARNRLKEYDLDEEYLDSIWNGKCAITGIDIQLKQGKSNLLTASLDRIDSSKGYVKGNVQFVCYGINLAKNSFTDKDVLEFVRQIRAS
jgi:hypothetical protein